MLARLALSLILLAAAPPVAAQSAPVGFPPELDAYVAKAVKDWGIPGLGLAIVRNDSVLVAKGYGVRELGKPERVDAHTVFDAASLTKAFTATAIAMLVDSGRMRWDEPVRTYLPEVVFPDPYLTASVTVRDLLAHRTGLQAGNFVFRFTAYDRAEVLRRLRFFAREMPFRSGMIYSNVGYTVAGEAAARVAGTTWDSLIRTRIIEPLALRDTRLWSEGDPSAPGNVARPHAMFDGVQQSFTGADDRTSTSPAGAVQSSAWDLAQWMRFQLASGQYGGRRLVSAAALEETHAPQVIVPTPAAFRTARQLDYYAAYGMGWQVWDYRSHPMLWHSGNGNGQIAYMAILPKDRLGIVVLINSWRAPTLHGTLAGHILDAYLGFPTRDESGDALRADSAAQRRATDARQAFDASRVANTRPSRPLSSYAGTYADSTYGTITVRQTGETLSLQMARGEVADLSHWHYDTFLVRWRDPLFREYFSTRAAFTLGVEGQPDGLGMRLNRDTVSVRRTRP